ncbi:hypothetical protein [Chenggangzhangella methanolivorans]|uniref:Uncharacterized protein n=1 Tax=Chenggangzhangella methanolivorans TaxID=1437009 RepID=A0A9E6UQ17_9HYPH|nr:hypothetical protein [Chenggangzhangella methanolivorans]QZO00395.1 hypothetical protein K6K41_01095 [Chenggangzhangella methanolivorans]
MSAKPIGFRRTLALKNGSFMLLYNNNHFLSGVKISGSYKDTGEGLAISPDYYTGDKDPACVLRRPNGDLVSIYNQPDDLKQRDIRYKLLSPEGATRSDGFASKKAFDKQRTPSCAALKDGRVFFTYYLLDANPKRNMLMGAYLTIEAARTAAAE